MASPDQPPPPPNRINVGSPGARIDHNYLVRKQNVIGVNESDLRELLTFDLVQQVLMGLGVFFLAGSSWLGLEKILEQPEFQLTPLIGACIAFSVCGVILFVVGVVFFLLRRGKIRKIFSEVSEL